MRSPINTESEQSTTHYISANAQLGEFLTSGYGPRR